MMLELTDFDDSTELTYEHLIETEGVEEEQIIQALKNNVSNTIDQLYNNREQINGSGKGAQIPDAEQ